MSTELTRAEFFEKYGQVEVTFSSYYKYTFTYIGQLPDGATVTVGYGGASGEIYKYDVKAGDKESILSLDPYCGSVERDGVTVEEFYDFR